MYIKKLFNYIFSQRNYNVKKLFNNLKKTKKGKTL